MSQIDIQAAAADLPALIERARCGEEVVLSAGGEALAKLVPLARSTNVHQPVKLGRLEGRFNLPEDFDAPLPAEILDLFEGKA